MKVVAAGRDALLSEQRHVDGVLQAVEALSGLASLGAYAVLRADGAEAAWAFLGDVRRPLAPAARGPRRRAEPDGDAAAGFDVLVAPLVTAVGSAALVVTRPRPWPVSTVTAVPLPGLDAARLRTVLTPWIKACHRADAGDLTLRAVDLEAALSRLTRGLGTALGRPLRRSLRDLGVAAGGLCLVPIHALPTGRRTILWDDFEVVYRPWPLPLPPSGPGVRRAGPGSALVVADPDGTLGAPAIREGDAVEASLLRAGLAVDRLGRGRESATPAAFLDKARAARVIHFAGHGHYDWRDPLGSGLLMSPPHMLTGRAIALRASLPSCDLCVLSGCGTGLSDPGARADASVGLPAALIEAGATTVVASLWPVRNVGAARLLAELHRRHLDDGEPPAEALRGAALDLRRRGAGDARDGQPDDAALSISWAAFGCYEGRSAAASGASRS